MSKNTENQVPVNEVEKSDLKEALSVVELEERFEMTAAVQAADRCLIVESAELQ